MIFTRSACRKLRSSTKSSTQASIRASMEQVKLKAQKHQRLLQQRQQKQKLEQEMDPDTLKKECSKKYCNGVYECDGTYYLVEDGNINYFITNKPVKHVTLQFLRGLELCYNSDVLIGLHEEIDDRREDNYVHVSSSKHKVDNFGEIRSANECELEVAIFENMISNKENGTREYDTEDVSDVVTIEWKDIDELETMRELPWWTDSEPDSSDNDSEDEDSD